MDNYEYIIASLPDISVDKGPSGETPLEIKEFIRSQLSEKDLVLADLLKTIWQDDKLTKELYSEGLASKNRFIKEYFSFDLTVKNAKVRHLNKALGRPEDEDVFLETDVEPELEEALDKIYSGTDILAKEKALDKLVWEKIEEVTTFDYFDIEAVLAFLAKLHIVERWMILDEETGRQLFRQLTREVQSTFKGVDFKE